MSDKIDGIVINQNILGQHLTRRLVKLSLNDLPINTSIAAIKALAVTKRTDAIKLLHLFLGHPNSKVRLAVLEEAHSQAVIFSTTTLLPLLNDNSTRKQAIQLLGTNIPPSVATRIRNYALNSREKKSTRLVAIEQLSTMDAAPLITNKLLKSVDIDIQIAAIKYWHQIHRETIISRTIPPPIESSLSSDNERLIKELSKIMANRRGAWVDIAFKLLLARTALDIDLRRSILSDLSHRATSVRLKTVWQLAKLRHDPLSLDAISHLGRYPNRGQDSYLWSILKNKLQNTKVRFAAAEALSHRYPKDVVDFLY